MKLIEKDNWRYVIMAETDTVEIKEYLGDDMDVTIPDQINNVPVTSIVLFGSNGQTITIPNSVSHIAYRPSGCNFGRFKVSPENPYFSAIDGVLFEHKSKRLISYPCDNRELSYVIPDGTFAIGEHAFHGCQNLTNVIIPDSVTSIGECAFLGCESLTSVTIPDSVISIKDYAFHGCSNLDEVNISDNLLTSIDVLCCFGRTPWLSKRYPQMVFDIDINGLLRRYYGNETVLSIPDSVISIGDEAFYYCNRLTSITIPNSVASIGHYAFAECSSLDDVFISDALLADIDVISCFNRTPWLSQRYQQMIFEIDSNSILKKYHGTEKYVTIPDGVTSIGAAAFSRCSNLSSVIIPDSVASIGNRTFLNCISLSNVAVSRSVICIGDEAFYGCKSLINITIPDSVTSIGDKAFKNCVNLTITVTCSSYAEQYCIDRGLNYKYAPNN